MHVETLKEAVAEAQRFIDRANDLLKIDGVHQGVLVSQPREQGAVKRASMDLTRKLADLRAGR